MKKIKEINITQDDKINIKDVDLDKILVHKRPDQGNIFTYLVACKTLYGEELLQIGFDEVDDILKGMVMK